MSNIGLITNTIVSEAKPPKRDDIQCWRAFSITAVLFFHLWPGVFPNGFVGVDM